MSGTITIGGMATGMLTGSKVIGPSTILGSIAECAITTVILVGGDNVIPVPTGAYAFMFQPCSGLANITYRTVEDDEGSFISPMNPTVIAFDQANTPTEFYLNVGTAVAGTFSEITFI